MALFLILETLITANVRLTLHKSMLCFGGSNPAWGMVLAVNIVNSLYGPATHRRVLYV